MLVSINITVVKKTHKIYQNPSLLPDLMVRVKSITAHFAFLPPAFRQLVVDWLLYESTLLSGPLPAQDFDHRFAGKALADNRAVRVVRKENGEGSHFHGQR